MAAAIHFKFASFKEKQTIAFDGFNMSVKDVKQEIMERLKLKATQDNLILTNSQTAKAYTDDSTLIQKNTTLLVRRVPKNSSVKKEKIYVVYKGEGNKTSASRTYKAIKKSTLKSGSLDSLKKVSTLKDEIKKVNSSSEDISQGVKTIAQGETENDKIKKAIEQSKMDYDIAKMTASSIRAHKIQKVKCFNCFKTGHTSQQCQMQKSDGPTVRPSTGIPSTMMVEASKDDRGAMLNPDGKYVVSLVDKKGYEEGKKEKPPFISQESESESEDEEPIPDEYVCGICNKLIDDAMLAYCCGYSFCDICIRSVLIENGICPLCNNKCSPDKLLPNISIRLAIRKFRRNHKSHRPMWPKAAPPAKFVNKNVSLTQSLKPAIKTTKDTSKGVPYKVVSTNNSVKKKPSAPIGPIRIQIPVPKMDPAELKAKTDAILKDTAEAEAAEKAEAEAAEKAAAAELIEQEKLVKLSEKESLKAEQELENETKRDSKSSSRNSVNEENVVTDQKVEDNDNIVSSEQIKSIEPLTSSSHSNVEHPVSHVLPIQSVAEPLKVEEISNSVMQNSDEFKTKKSSEKQLKEENSQKSNNEKKRSCEKDRTNDRRRKRSTSRNRRDDRYDSRSYRYKDSDRDRRRRNSPENYRDLNPILTTNTGHFPSTQAISLTSSILGEAPSKPINILPQIPPITTPFSVPPPTLNPYINPLLHSSYLGLPPTIDTSVPPPNLIPPPNFLFPQTINPTISQMLPQINTDATKFFKGQAKKFDVRPESPLNDRHRRREYSPASFYRRDYKKRDHRYQTSRHSKRDRRRSRSFSPYYTSRERSFGTLTGSSSHSSRSRSRSPMKRKMRYGKTLSRRERSPGRHHDDKYKSSKRRYNSREKQTSHHRSRTPQKRPRKRRDSRSASRGRQQRRNRSKERRRKEQELLLASEAKIYQHQSERQTNVNKRSYQPRPVIGLGHAGEPSPPGESLDVYDPSQVNDVLQRESFYEKMHQNLLKGNSENFHESPQGLWSNNQDFENGNSADDATPVRDELSPSDNYHGNEDSRRLVISNEQRKNCSPAKNIKYKDDKNHRSVESSRRIYRSKSPNEAPSKKDMKKSSRRVVEDKKSSRNQSKSKKPRKSIEKEKRVEKSNNESSSLKVKNAKEEVSFDKSQGFNKSKNKQKKDISDKLDKSQDKLKYEQNKSPKMESSENEKVLSPLSNSSKTKDILPPGENALPIDEVVKPSKSLDENSFKQNLQKSLTKNEDNEDKKNVSKIKVLPKQEPVSNKEKIEEKQKILKKNKKKPIVPVQYPQAPKSKWDTDNEEEKHPVVKRKKNVSVKGFDTKNKIKKTEPVSGLQMKPRKIKIKTVKTRPGTTDAEKEIPKHSSASRKVLSKAVTLKRKSTDQSAQQNDARSIIEKNIAKRRKVSVESTVVSAPKQSVTSESTKNKVLLDFSSKDEELTNTEASLENCDSNSSSTDNETKKLKAERKAEKAAKKLKKKKKKSKKI